MNGAQLIAEILKREGTEFLSCYPRNPLIEVPPEVWEADYKGEFDYAPMAVERSGPDPDAIKKAVRMLLAAKNPILWAGQGVHYAEAGDRLAELAELLPAPVVTTNPGKSAIAENHPLSLG